MTADFDPGSFFDAPVVMADNKHELESDGVFCSNPVCTCHETGDRNDQLIIEEEKFTIRDLAGKLAAHQARFLKTE